MNLDHLLNAPRLSLDTETSGLRPFHGDRLFSIIVADDQHEYYLDFRKGMWSEQERGALQRLFTSVPLFFMHNAAFDLDFLHKEGFAIPGKIHDTMVTERLLHNTDMSYALDRVAKKYGFEKSDEVKKYCDKHKLYTKINLPWKKLSQKSYHYDKVPDDVIIPYAKQDARITFEIGRRQLQKLAKAREGWPGNLPTLLDVYENECLLIKTCFAMRQTGIKLDTSYLQEASAVEVQRYNVALEEYKCLTGETYMASAKRFQGHFERLGFKLSLTDKGNPELTDDVLETITHPLARTIQTIRAAYKRRGVFENLLYYTDDQGLIHINLRQSGTVTGRFSSSDPNLQNIETEDESNYPIRRAFIPRDKDNILLEIDYKALEFRLFVDYAKIEELAASIQAGLDPHEETAKLVGISRREAKTLNFAILYGAGAEKIGGMLGISKDEAFLLRQKYFAALPEIRTTIGKCTDSATRRGFVFNWLGRRCYCDNKDFAYKSANALIQGGGADIVKVAMNQLHDYLKDTTIKMTLQVHDSIMFEGPHLEVAKHYPSIVKIMRESYRHKILSMDVDAEYSFNSWQDMEGINVTEAGDFVFEKGEEVLRRTSIHNVLQNPTGGDSGNTGPACVS